MNGAVRTLREILKLMEAEIFQKIIAILSDAIKLI